MQGRSSAVALATAAIAVLGLSIGVAAAGPASAGQAGSAPRPLVHGTLRPDIHRSSGGRAAFSPQGLPIQYSGNWSGYIALPQAGGASSFKYVAAHYSVPSVNCTTTNTAFAYQWVGLDGDTDGTVEQDGVGSYCVSGSPTYFAWSEMFPAGVDVQFYLNPGDAITSSVTFTPSTGKYKLTLADVTSGQSFSVIAACASSCNNSSAEVITEGYPSGSYGGTSDFGAEHYDSIQVGGNTGAKGGIINSHWAAAESIATGASSDVTTEPGALYSTSAPAAPHMSAFEDDWLSED
jgi:hypothetical protein